MGVSPSCSWFCWPYFHSSLYSEGPWAEGTNKVFEHFVWYIKCYVSEPLEHVSAVNFTKKSGGTLEEGRQN